MLVSVLDLQYLILQVSNDHQEAWKWSFYIEEAKHEDAWTTQPEEQENIMQDNKVNMLVSVDTSKAFQTIPAFDVIYDQKVSNMKEADLFAALGKIEKESEALKNLGTGKASKRITAQIAQLKDAKDQVISAIDDLPEEGDDE